ncbi:MAG: molecular chaperone [Deltaproteobacteria bacterium]|nr:molecular chaperone [Deltaproteobacteria bacterium]
MIKKWFFALGLLVLLGIWEAQPAAAQLNLLVSPIRVEQKLQPGSSETDIISVRNEGGRPVRVKVYLEDWQMDAKGSLTYFRPGRVPQSCAAWLQLNPADFRVEAGQTREVRFTLTVPPGAKTGTYWAAIIFEGLPVEEKVTVQKRIGVLGRIGVVLYQTVGNPEVKAQFQDLQVVPDKKGVTFKIAFTNPGQGFVRVKKSWIAVKNSQGQEVAKLEIPDIPVLPGGSRDLELKHEKPLPPGNYQVEAVVDLGRRELQGRKKPFTVGR